MVQYICIYVVIVIRVSKRNSLNSLTGEVSSDGSKIFQTGEGWQPVWGKNIW